MFGNFGSILLAALGISFLIFIHELGHFLAARLFKVRVETFSVGFGPRVWGFRRGDTDYRLSAVPLGGYVKMAGEYGELRDGSALAADDLTAKPAWQRAVIFAAGVIVNVLFAFVVFPVAFAVGVPFTAPVIGSVVEGGPAWQAGLQAGDEVLGVDGHRVYGFPDVALEVALSDPAGTALRVRRDGRESEVLLRATRNTQEERLEIGIGPASSRRLAVEPDGVAHSAGLRNGDELLDVDGAPLPQDEGLDAFLARRMGEGLPLTLGVLRDGERVEARLQPRRVVVEDQLLLGFLPADTAVVALRGPALAPSGLLQPGDVVREVAGVPVASAQALRDAAEAAPAGALPLVVLRGSERLELQLPPAQRAWLARDVAFDFDHARTLVRVLPDGAVAAAGLRDGDEILALDGEPVRDYPDLQERARTAHGTGRHRITFRSPGAEARTLEVDPRPPVRWDYGCFVTLAEVHHKEDLPGALAAGWQTSLNMLRTTGMTLSRLVTGDVGAQNLGGIVSISVMTYHFADTGLTRLLFFLGLLSINLAILNILPIPVLDGGQMVFLLLEKLKGGRLSERFLNGAQLAGLVVIVALVLFVTYQDIARLVS
jgi:regulator of sigma E protease